MVKKKQDDEEEEDRLSNLPDNLLITILSLIPIDSSAATSALSRRWRHLWTHLTHISFPPPQKPAFENVLYFFTTVPNILSQLNSPKIHSFELELGFNLPEECNHLCSAFLRHWIHQICLRNPETIQLSASNYNQGLFYKLHVNDLAWENEEEDRLRKEYEFCKKLFVVSGSSLSCDIKFSGDAIIASREDFKDGVLTCQIIDHPI